MQKVIRKNILVFIIICGLIIGMVMLVLSYFESKSQDLYSIYETNYNPKIVCIEFDDNFANIITFTKKGDSKPISIDQRFIDIPVGTEIYMTTNNPILNFKKTIVLETGKLEYTVVTEVSLFNMVIYKFTRKYLYGGIVS